MPSDLRFFGMVPGAGDLAGLAAAAETAWGARVRVSRFGALRATSASAGFDATPACDGAQPFSGELSGGAEAATARLAALSEALRARGLPHRLELVDGDDEIGVFAHAWPDVPG